MKRNLLLILLFSVLLTILWVIYTHFNVLSLVDFVEYWSSGRLNITGGNPYDPEQMLTMELSAGWNENEALMMLNPPWVLSYAMFFGIFNYTFSRFLCYLIQTCIIFLCSILIWRIYHGDKRSEWMSWIIAFSFGPTLHALKSGQVTILVFGGSVGFLYFLSKKSDFWAGILASLTLFKPHLLYLFVLIVIIWSISHRRYYVLIGMLTGLITSLGVALFINPQILSQYIYMMKSYPLENWMTPTLGAYLRLLIGPDKFYLQFIPSIIGIVCFMAYWIRRHQSFDWITNLPLIILISIATSPYGWILDSTVSVFSVILIAVLFNYSHWTFKKMLILTTYWCINFIITFLSVTQIWLWWFPSFLLIWYLLSHLYLITKKTALINPDRLVTT